MTETDRASGVGDGSSRGGSPSADTGRWRVLVDQARCSLCEVCARRCPTQAHHTTTDGEGMKLLFRAAACHGCRGPAAAPSGAAAEGERCEVLCPEKALFLQVDGADVRSPEPVVLAQGAMLGCARCGNAFAALCKLEAVLEKGKHAREDLGDLCPPCRRAALVVKFIDEHRAPDGTGVRGG